MLLVLTCVCMKSECAVFDRFHVQRKNSISSVWTVDMHAYMQPSKLSEVWLHCLSWAMAWVWGGREAPHPWKGMFLSCWSEMVWSLVDPTVLIILFVFSLSNPSVVYFCCHGQLPSSYVWNGSTYSLCTMIGWHSTLSSIYLAINWFIVCTATDTLTLVSLTLTLSLKSNLNAKNPLMDLLSSEREKALLFFWKLI